MALEMSALELLALWSKRTRRNIWKNIIIIWSHELIHRLSCEQVLCYYCRQAEKKIIDQSRTVFSSVNNILKPKKLNYGSILLLLLESLLCLYSIFTSHGSFRYVFDITIETDSQLSLSFWSFPGRDMVLFPELHSVWCKRKKLISFMFLRLFWGSWWDFECCHFRFLDQVCVCGFSSTNSLFYHQYWKWHLFKR